MAGLLFGGSSSVPTSLRITCCRLGCLGRGGCFAAVVVLFGGCFATVSCLLSLGIFSDSIFSLCRFSSSVGLHLGGMCGVPFPYVLFCCPSFRGYGRLCVCLYFFLVFLYLYSFVFLCWQNSVWPQQVCVCNCFLLNEKRAQARS